MGIRLPKIAVNSPARTDRQGPFAGRRAVISSIARIAALAALPGLAACAGHSHGGATYVTSAHPPAYYEYYYYPHAGVYYHIATGYYFYYFNGDWRRARTRPRYIYLDDRHRTIIVIREGQPYQYNEAHQRKFGPPRADRYGRGPGPARPEGSTQNAGWGRPQEGQPHPRDYGQSQGQHGGQGQAQGQHNGNGRPYRPIQSQGQSQSQHGGQGQPYRPPQSQGQSQGQRGGQGGTPSVQPAAGNGASSVPRGNGQGRPPAQVPARPEKPRGKGKPPTQPACPDQANGKGRC